MRLPPRFSCHSALVPRRWWPLELHAASLAFRRQRRCVHVLEQERGLGLVVLDPESASVCIRALIVTSRRVLPAFVVRFDAEEARVVAARSADLVLWPVSPRW